MIEEDFELDTTNMSAKHRDFVDKHYLCPLCENAYEFEFQICHEHGSVTEIATCPECKVQARQSSHTFN